MATISSTSPALLLPRLSLSRSLFAPGSSQYHSHILLPSIRTTSHGSYARAIHTSCSQRARAVAAAATTASSSSPSASTSKPTKKPPSHASRKSHPPTTTATTTTTSSATLPIHPSIPTQTSSYIPTTSLFATTLAARPSPTLLYLAPASAVYPYACLTISAFCSAYGVVNFHDAYFVAHPGLLWIIPHLMAGVSVFMTGVGVWIGLGARKLVGGMSAVPVEAGGGGGGGGGGRGGRSLRVRVDKRRLWPWSRHEVVEVDVGVVQLGGRVVATLAGLEEGGGDGAGAGRLVGSRAGGGNAREREKMLRMTPAQRKAYKETKSTEGKTLWKTLTEPFYGGVTKVRRGIGRVIARDGIVKMYINGKLWRVDVKNCWLLDNGVAMDRLFKIRDTQQGLEG